MPNDVGVLQKPFEVIFAVRLLCLSVALDVLNTTLNWDALISLLPSDLAFDRDLFSFFAKIFTTALIVWFICKISLGYNWTRILFFLGFILSVPIAIPTMIAMLHYSKIYLFIAAAITLFQFLALSLLFSDSGNAWFKAQKSIPKEEH